MGWKAAEKLIRHWKVLRGDHVRLLLRKDHILPSFFAVFILFSFLALS
uniref:Uncharacterized protein n=1 Tax=Rhizophora mucronata TaxID=61149 RepID=A0A2P2K4W3_RHIMU